MTTPKRPWWQQATALVSLSAGGAVTGFAFAPKAAAADIESPSNMNIRLLALTQAAKPPPADDSTLRTAIVNVATYYLRMAEGKTPAEMEQLIWQHDSLDGVDHGESCAAFASLTLELAAQVVGQQSWVSGGTSYPWPLHKWVDARVDPNPDSLQITSVLQDAEAHHRWHPLGDGYRPLPGDWVLFDGHVEVVTKYDNGVLSTIGGDSLPNFSVNAHEYTGSLADDGVAGFVNNGKLAAAPSGPKTPDPGAGPGPGAQSGPGSPGNSQAGSGPERPGRGGHQHGSGAKRDSGQTDSGQPPGHAGQPGQAAIPGVPAGAGAPAGAGSRAGRLSRRSAPRQTATGLDASAAIPGMPALTPADERQPQTRRRSSGQGVPRAERPGGSPTSHQGGGSPAGAPGAAHQGGAGSLTKRQAPGSPQAGRPATGGSQTGPAASGGTQPAHGGTQAGRPARTGPKTAQAIQAGSHTGPGSPGWSEIPGVPGTIETSAAKPGKPGQPAASHPAPPPASTPATPAAAAPTSAERTFIDQIAPGAIAAQRKYGVPAAVTIAQAILESGWGTSTLAAQDHNLFGIKGTGPAGGALYPTTEYVNGRPVARTAEFRVYHDVAQSLDDHGRLIADSGYYGQAMAHQHDPTAFANALTGVYATDPDYGTKLIGMMQQYRLYRYDAAASHPTAAPPTTDSPSSGTPSSGTPSSGTPSSGTPSSGTPSSVIPNSDIPSSGGSGQAGPGTLAKAAPKPGSVSVASIPGLPVSVPPTSPAPVTKPHKPAPPVSTPPSSPTPRRTPPISTAPAPRPTRTTPAPAPSPTAGTPRSSPSPARTAPARTAPARTAPARTASAKPPSTRTPSAKTPSTKTAPTKTAPTKTAPTKTGFPSARPSRAARPAPETVRTTRLDADVRPAPGAGAPRTTAPAVDAVSARRMRPSAEYLPPRRAHGSTRTGRARHRDDMPPAVRNSFNLMAKAPLMAKKSLYQDVASQTGVPWQLLGACDWMQCKADSRFSPVHGEKLGTANPDGTMYRTKSEALDQCADDLVELAWEVYEIDVPGQAHLSVCDLANVFAAFRWGGLLRLHHTSAMEFPYSVAGLTESHLHMRWPNIDESNTPDKPGAKFRMPFGAVPVVLNLNYPAVD